MNRSGEAAVLRGSGFVRVFAIPSVIAVASGVGLVSALVGDGVWDALSWITLGAPLAIIGWYTARPTRA